MSVTTYSKESRILHDSENKESIDSVAESGRFEERRAERAAGTATLGTAYPMGRGTARGRGAGFIDDRKAIGVFHRKGPD